MFKIIETRACALYIQTLYWKPNLLQEIQASKSLTSDNEQLFQQMLKEGNTLSWFTAEGDIYRVFFLTGPQGPGNFQGPELLAAPGIFQGAWKFSGPGNLQAPWKIPGSWIFPGPLENSRGVLISGQTRCGRVKSTVFGVYSERQPHHDCHDQDGDCRDGGRRQVQVHEGPAVVHTC